MTLPHHDRKPRIPKRDLPHKAREVTVIEGGRRRIYQIGVQPGDVIRAAVRGLVRATTGIDIPGPPPRVIRREGKP